MNRRSHPGPRTLAPGRGPVGPALLAGSLTAALGVAAALGCSPIVRDADFVGARTRVTDAPLVGPFDGQVVDESTDKPVQGANVVGIWSYDEGDGFVGPHGSEQVEVKTDAAGRYRIPAAPQKVRGRHVRLVTFALVVYKRGYVAYRSDTRFEGGRRSDFSLRHNRVSLRKWRDTDSHAEHLLFLAAPPTVARQAAWERDAANLDLYRAQGGEAVAPREEAPRDPASTLRLLDAAALLPPAEVRRRTGYADAFEVGELDDLTRTHFYHGVHLEALDRDQQWDVAFRVWKNPPGGLDPVRDTFRATLPDVSPSGEVTPETWVYDSDDLRAVAFIDEDAEVGVLLSCGALQCVDIETAIILARYVNENLDKLSSIPADEVPVPTPAKPAPAGGAIGRTP